jgi:SAM-dependent methyltransferase
VIQGIRTRLLGAKKPHPVSASYIDAIVSGSIQGWASIGGRGQQRLIIERVGHPQAIIVADADRPDLAAAGVESAAGFYYQFDPVLRDGEEIAVRYENGKHISGSPVRYREPHFGDVGDLDEIGARTRIASFALRGSGIEIGALHRPLATSPGVRVCYVDRQNKADLCKHYPELAALPIVDPDIIDDGETLAKIGDESQDFVIASHFIEHCEDPIGAIRSWCRVLRGKGALFIVVPDRAAYFDRDRPLTSIEHLVQDHELGSQLSRKAHYLEFAELVNKQAGSEAYNQAAALDSSSYSIHFHVWTAESFLEMTGFAIRRYGLPLRLNLALHHHGELIAVFRKN